MRPTILCGLAVWLLVAPSAWAFSPSTAGGSCVVVWDEAPPPTIPLQYFLYARREGASYRFAIRDPSGGHPVASAENAVGIVTQALLCDKVVLAGDGRWYIVVTAVAMDLSEETPPSNELWLDVRAGRLIAWGEVSPDVPPPAPTPAPPPPSIPPVPSPPSAGRPKDMPAPPALIVMPPSSSAPASSSGSGSLSESCIWNSCQRSSLPRTLPPGFGQGSPSLADSPIWNGTPR